MSLAIFDLQKGDRVAVHCAHGTVLAAVTVTGSNAMAPSRLQIDGTVSLYDGVLGEMALNSILLLGMPWAGATRTMHKYTGSTGLTKPRCGCTFLPK